MEHEVQEAVLKVAKKSSETLERQTGIEPSMTADEVKDYFDQVLNELKRKTS